MGESDERLIEWLKEETQILFGKVDKQGEKFEALEKSVRDLEKTFIMHSPCTHLRKHISESKRQRTWELRLLVVMCLSIITLLAGSVSEGAFSDLLRKIIALL